MKLDPAVIQDLLPLYLAGEASPASRKLVEEHLAADPELARLARAAADPEVARLASVLPPPSSGKAALDATRRLLRRRSWLMGCAIFTTALPFSLHGNEHGIQFFLLRDAPATAAVSFAIAALLWVAFWRVSRRLGVTGL
ncbi:MAG: zf-HC2 domain-containing protein [Thermoanaerobaculia bacterium]|nr:zf-HC2 domain-containing protein [Thermoanaerobaculia bacterium]